VAQNTKLTAVGFDRGLDACVLLNGGTGKVSDKTMATTVEAILGAVELDAGSEALVQVATRLGLIHSSLTPVTSSSSLPEEDDGIHE
jgi:ribonuclease III